MVPNDVFWRNLALDEAHTWECAKGHRNVTWAHPAPNVGERHHCGPCSHPITGLGVESVLAVTVVTGVPFDYVREILG
jgi:hypothetical protein